MYFDIQWALFIRLMTLNHVIKPRRVPRKHINVKSRLKQRWPSTFINAVSTLIFGWKWKLSRRIFIDVVSTLTKQRWNNVYRIISIQRRWTNVISTLKFGWKWKLSQRIFIDVVSTLTKQSWKNYVDSMLITQCCFSVDIWLKRKVESTFIGVEKIALKHLCQNLFYLFTRKWLNNKTKLSFQV